MRDLLVLTVDPSRAQDPEIAGEGERARRSGRALLARRSAARVRPADQRAESDIRQAAQPRYHLEMALLRWIYLRKLAPIEDLIAGAGSPKPDVGRAAPAPAAKSWATYRFEDGTARCRPGPSHETATRAPAVPPSQSRRSALAATECVFQGRAAGRDSKDEGRVLQHRRRAGAEDRGRAGSRDVHVLCHPGHVAEHGRAESSLARVARPADRRQEDHRGQHERRRERDRALRAAEPAKADKKSALREQAMADAGVQALLEVFPAEIRDVEEM